MGIINDTFMLKNKTAQKLFSEYAKDMPIIDYHCHINPKEIYEDRRKLFIDFLDKKDEIQADLNSEKEKVMKAYDEQLEGLKKQLEEYDEEKEDNSEEKDENQEEKDE